MIININNKFDFQISTQTGEDNIDIEIQTEKIIFKNKWTQFPITCRNNIQTKEDLDLFCMVYKSIF